MVVPRKTKPAAASRSAAPTIDAPSTLPVRQRSSTIKDVALAAQVSTATVSKFINGGQRFTSKVESRIVEAVNQLGYSSNPMARGMITGRTGNIGVVILDIRNPHFGSLIRGASRIAASTDMNILFADVAESRSPELAVLQSLSRRVDGLIVSARIAPPVVEWLRAAGTPVIFYGGPAPHADYRSVTCDNHAAGFMLGRHLRELGHRHIGYIGFSAARWSDERLRGLRDAFEGVRSSFAIFDVPAPTAEGGEGIASRVLLGAKALDAVVAFNDLIALGFMSEARHLGVKLPQQLSVAGFDNIVYSGFVTPSLTTVDMCSEKIGEVAMKQLLTLIETGRQVAPADQFSAPLRVIARESTVGRS